MECDCLQLCLSVCLSVCLSLLSSFKEASRYCCFLCSVFPRILAPLPCHLLIICRDNPQPQCSSSNSPPTEKAEEEPKGRGDNLGGTAEVQRLLAEPSVQVTSGAHLTAPEWPLGQWQIEQGFIARGRCWFSRLTRIALYLSSTKEAPISTIPLFSFLFPLLPLVFLRLILPFPLKLFL